MHGDERFFAKVKAGDGNSNVRRLFAKSERRMSVYAAISGALAAVFVKFFHLRVALIRVKNYDSAPFARIMLIMFWRESKSSVSASSSTKSRKVSQSSLVKTE